MMEDHEIIISLKAAYNALRSYQYGNSSTELAEEVANHLEEVINKETTQYDIALLKDEIVEVLKRSLSFCYRSTNDNPEFKIIKLLEKIEGKK